MASPSGEKKGEKSTLFYILEVVGFEPTGRKAYFVQVHFPEIYTAWTHHGG